MSDQLWKPNPNGTVADHWIDLIDPLGWYKATVKWDGCIHYHRAYNVPFPEDPKDTHQDVDYIHICDIDQEIARLQALKAAALEHFGEWPR